MLGDLWKGLGGRLANRWLAALLSPALLFWIGGLAAWLWAYGSSTIEDRGWVGALKEWTTANIQELPAVAKGLLVLIPLLLIALSGLLLQQLSLPVLRLLEGHWPSLLDRPRDRLRTRLSDRIDRDVTRLRILAGPPAATLSAREYVALSRLERRRTRAPADPRLRMPTRLGNVLRTAESHPSRRYGLDAVVSWPRLWLLLPDPTREEIVKARSALYLTAQVWLCGLLLTFWTIWAWWAAPVGLTIAAIAYYVRMLTAAAIYGDLIQSCYDVHRRLLYMALCWPLPGNPNDERSQGVRLTTYLRAGSRADTPSFT